MGYHDTQQVCLNGHQITDRYHRSPEFHRAFCDKCGAKTIHQCPSCNTEIKGKYHIDGVVAIGFRTPVPKFCVKCGAKFPWADKLDDDEVTKLDPGVSVDRICNRISLVIRQLRVRHGDRQAHDVEDEYDLQDLLHALLHLFFDDVRPEEYTPSYAGKAARMDFLLKEESIVIEAKMTRKGLGAKEVGEQLMIDIGRYKAHPSCKTLYCLVYDPEHRITNPRGLERDLSRKSDGLDAKVFVVPSGT
jgi:hypothetical protein